MGGGTGGSGCEAGVWDGRGAHRGSWRAQLRQGWAAQGCEVMGIPRASCQGTTGPGHCSAPVGWAGYRRVGGRADVGMGCDRAHTLAQPHRPGLCPTLSAVPGAATWHSHSSKLLLWESCVLSEGCSPRTPHIHPSFPRAAKPPHTPTQCLQPTAHRTLRPECG